MLEGTEYYTVRDTVRDDDDDDPVLVHHPSGSDVDTWREGYPYDHRMSRAEYEEQKRLLQIELLKLQKWSQANGLRHVIVFEGRDAAQVPLFEQMLVNDGISLTKLWFSVTQSEQRTRFTIRQVDPVRQWKLSPTDLASLDK
jgi:polyphosphate kinase 2 (PPK2 family)